LLPLVVSQLRRLAETDKFNLFFGVCPRFGNKGRFDLAWQIRIARALWTDSRTTCDLLLSARLRGRYAETAKRSIPSPAQRHVGSRRLA
jgi:hypothetical protein